MQFDNGLVGTCRRLEDPSSAVGPTEFEVPKHVAWPYPIHTPDLDTQKLANNPPGHPLGMSAQIHNATSRTRILP